MARSRTLVRIKLGLVLAALAFVLAPRIGVAQSLPRLEVERFTMTAQPASPTIGRAFALTIVLTVRGNVRRIDNVTLPILSQLELRGDERTLHHTNGTSIYRETLTVRAARTGAILLAPATLDAIDARTGQAEQYSSNPLTIVVRGGALQPFATVGSAVGNLVPIVLRIAEYHRPGFQEAVNVPQRQRPLCPSFHTPPLSFPFRRRPTVRPPP